MVCPAASAVLYWHDSCNTMPVTGHEVCSKSQDEVKEMRGIVNSKMLFVAFVLVVFMTGCGSDGGGGSAGQGAGPTGGICAGAGCANLGTTANYVIVAKAGINNTPISVITGDVAITPAFAASITGFSMTVDASNDFSTSVQVTGRLYAPDYTGGQSGSAGTTPAKMITVQTDMVTAYNDVAGRPGGVGATNLNLGAGTIATGQNFVPGTYTWNTPGTAGGNVNMTGNITLTGSATDIWIFQIEGILNLASGTNITLAGGAQPKNVFWVVAGGATIGTTAHFEGILLSQTAITLGTGATVRGRLQAQSAVTLAGNTVIVP